MIRAIFATDVYGGMGYHGKLPWGNIPEDMEHFKNTTMNNVVVMGRKTYETLPNSVKPFPGRINAVVSSTNIRSPKTFIHNIKSNDILTGILKLQEQWPNKDVFIIGGPTLLMATIPLIEHVHLTSLQGSYSYDAWLDKRKFFEHFRFRSATPLINNCIFEEYTKK